MVSSLTRWATGDPSVRASALYVSSGILAQSMALVLSPLWTRVMTKSEYGIIAVVQPIAVFTATIAGLGLQNGVARLVHDEPRGADSQRDIAKSIIAFQFTVLAAAFLIVLGLIRLNSDSLGRVLGFPAGPYLYLAMAGAFLAVAGGLLTRTSQTFELPWPVFWSRIAMAIVGGALILVLVVFDGMQGTGMLIARAAGAGSMLIVLAASLRPIAGAVVRSRVVHAALRFSLPLLPYQLSALLLDGADRIVLNEFHGEASVAPYALAYAIGGGAMLLLGSSVLHAEAPSFYQAMREEDYALAGRRTIRRIEFLTLVAVGANLLGGPLLTLIYDARYDSSAALLPPIVSGLFFWCVFSFKNFTLLARKRTGLSSVVTVATAVANLGLNIAVIPRWGATGAAIATLASYFAQAMVGIVAERALAPVPQYLGRFALCAIAVLASSFFASAFLAS